MPTMNGEGEATEHTGRLVSHAPPSAALRRLLLLYGCKGESKHMARDRDRKGHQLTLFGRQWVLFLRLCLLQLVLVEFGHL